MRCRGIVFVILCCTVFSGCAKAQPEESSGAMDSNVVAVADGMSAVPARTVSAEGSSSYSSEQEKLRTVFSRLSQRTRDGIINGNPTEFLADLQAVLDWDTDDLLTLTDKQHYLSPDFVPADIVPLEPNDLYRLNRSDLSLRVPVEVALREMAAAAQKDGITLLVSSTYRSYDYQSMLYDRNVRQLGKAVADRESAPPGASQHQLGSAVDFGSITDDFAETKAGRWLSENAHLYGWSLSFPDGYEDVTGYRWECWHYRYIGVPAAQFQKKWFSDIQQFMLEFIHEWRAADE